MSFDFFDHFRLNKAIETVEHLKKAVSTPNPFIPKLEDVETLQQVVGELRLQLAVVYRLLLTKGICTEAEVYELISSFDQADGKSDGQFDGDPVSGISIATHPEEVEELIYPEIRTT